MNQDIFQVFFDIPEVVGVGLIDGQTQLALYVKEQIINCEEKQNITQDTLQIVSNKSEEFDLFEFPLFNYYAYVYKLNHNIHLLVLTYAIVTKQLKDTLQKDIETAISNFNVLTQKISQFTIEIKVTAEELLNALNQLSKFISKYIGFKITANYLELTCPQFEWLNNFQINHSAKITFSSMGTKPISALQHQWVKQWVAAFIKRCTQFLKDLPTLIEQKALDESQKEILLGYSTNSLIELKLGP